MAELSRTVFDAALKEYYLGPLRDQINRATILFDKLETKTYTVNGRNQIIPHISRKHVGVASRSGATRPALPTAQTQSYVASTWAMRYHYGRIEVDGPAMRSSSSDKGAFARALDAEIKGITAALSQDLNRQCWSDGNALAEINAQATTDQAVIPVDDVKFFEVGQLISLIQYTRNNTNSTEISTTTCVNGGYTIGTVGTTTITVTTNLVGTVAAPTGTPVVAGCVTEGESTSIYSFRNGMWGLPALITGAQNPQRSGTVFVGLINRRTAANAFWRSNVLDNSGTDRAMTIGLLQQALLTPRNNKFGSGRDPNFGITNRDLWATLGNLLISDKRFRGETMKLDGGWTALDFSGVPVVWDKDATTGDFWFLNTENIFFLSQSQFEWMDEDGAILSRVSGYDSFEAVLYRDLELAVDVPAAHVRIADLATNLD